MALPKKLTKFLSYNVANSTKLTYFKQENWRKAVSCSKCEVVSCLTCWIGQQMVLVWPHEEIAQG